MRTARVQDGELPKATQVYPRSLAPAVAPSHHIVFLPSSQGVARVACAAS